MSQPVFWMAVFVCNVAFPCALHAVSTKQGRYGFVVAGGIRQVLFVAVHLAGCRIPLSTCSSPPARDGSRASAPSEPKQGSPESRTTTFLCSLTVVTENLSSSFSRLL